MTDLQLRILRHLAAIPAGEVSAADIGRVVLRSARDVARALAPLTQEGLAAIDLTASKAAGRYRATAAGREHIRRLDAEAAAQEASRRAGQRTVTMRRTYCNGAIETHAPMRISLPREPWERSA